MNVILNVQGQIFETNFNSLIKLSYFKDMFNDCGMPKETIFVDRSAHIFKHVLGIITDNLYPYPEKYKYELDFYGYDYRNLQFHTKHDDILKRLDKIENKCSNIGCKNERSYSLTLFCREHEYVQDEISERLNKIENKCSNIRCSETREEGSIFCVGHDSVDDKCRGCDNGYMAGGSWYCYTCQNY